jgi:hypothetical protein
VNVIFCEAGTALPPSSRQRNPDCIKNSGLAAVVWAYKYSRFTKLNVKGFYRAEILYADGSDPHGAAFTLCPSGLLAP